jgi:hypothetical protein
MSVLGKIARRIGRRGSYLLFLALLDVLFGWSLYTEPGILTKVYNLVLPVEAWGVIWFLVGIACLIQAFARQDRIAFTLAVALKIAWASVTLYSWLTLPTVPREWVSAIIWYAFAGITGIVSYWPEYRPFDLGDAHGDNE